MQMYSFFSQSENNEEKMEFPNSCEEHAVKAMSNDSPWSLFEQLLDPKSPLKAGKQLYAICILIKLLSYFSALVHQTEALFNDPFLSIYLTVANSTQQ